MNTSPTDLRDLIERLARLSTAEEWADGLNPSQRAALSYLAKANRFSRAPSHVADYLNATRGTVSQTLKALSRKGLVKEVRSATDKRSISYSLTNKGRHALQRTSAFEEALRSLPEGQRADISENLEGLARTALTQTNGKFFGQCKECRYHEHRTNGGFCALLSETLKPEETHQVCHEFQATG